MIDINLLPSAAKKKAARKGVDLGAMFAGANAGLKDKFLIGAIAVTVIVGAAAGSLYVLQTRREQTLATQLERAVRDSTKYSSLVRDRVRAEAVRDTVLRQVNIIKSIDEDRYIWPHVMSEVSRVLPQYTWLTSVAFTGTPQGSYNVVALPKPAATDTGKGAKPKRLLVGLLMVGLGGAYQQLMWTPQNLVLNGTAARVHALDSLNKSAKLEAAKGSASKLRAEADMYSRQLEVMRRLVPTENEVPAL